MSVWGAFVSLEKSFEVRLFLCDNFEWWRREHNVNLVLMANTENAPRIVQIFIKSRRLSTISRTYSAIVYYRKECLFPYLTYVITNRTQYNDGLRSMVLKRTSELESSLAIPFFQSLTNHLGSSAISGDSVCDLARAYLEEKVNSIEGANDLAYSTNKFIGLNSSTSSNESSQCHH